MSVHPDIHAAESDEEINSCLQRRNKQASADKKIACFPI